MVADKMATLETVNLSKEYVNGHVPHTSEPSVHLNKSGKRINGKAVCENRLITRMQSHSTASGLQASAAVCSDDLPGTQIALLVQNLHDASLRAMFKGEEANMMFSRPPEIDHTMDDSVFTVNDVGDYENGIADTEEVCLFIVFISIIY